MLTWQYDMYLLDDALSV